MSEELVIQVVHGSAGYESLEEDLRSLAANAERPHPFCSTEWLAAWNKRIGMVYNPVMLTVRDGDGRLVGAWPFVEQVALMGKGLWPMGYHTMDYVDPLCLTQEPALRVRLVEGLAQLLKDYRFIWLPLLRKEFAQDCCRPFFVRKRQPMLFDPGATRHYIRLGEQSMEDLLQESLGSKTRKTLRYTRRRLEEKGLVEYRAWRTRQEVEDFLPDFLRIEDGSWKAEAGVGLFSLLGIREFYQNLLPEMAAQGRVQLSSLLLDGRPMACELGFLMDDTYCLHNTSYLPEFAEHSPGRHLLLENLRRAAEAEKQCFDFMQGNQSYKQKLGTHSEPIYTVSLFQKSFAGRLNRWLIRGLQKSRRAKAKKLQGGTDQDF